MQKRGKRKMFLKQTTNQVEVHTSQAFSYWELSYAVSGLALPPPNHSGLT